MKITVWLRATKQGRGAKLRVDAKVEKDDTPRISHYGRRLMAAFEEYGRGIETDEK